jgi:hypothetical protein
MRVINVILFIVFWVFVFSLRGNSDQVVTTLNSLPKPDSPNANYFFLNLPDEISREKNSNNQKPPADNMLSHDIISPCNNYILSSHPISIATGKPIFYSALSESYLSHDEKLCVSLSNNAITVVDTQTGLQKKIPIPDQLKSVKQTESQVIIKGLSRSGKNIFVVLDIKNRDLDLNLWYANITDEHVNFYPIKHSERDLCGFKTELSSVELLFARYEGNSGDSKRFLLLRADASIKGFFKINGNGKSRISKDGRVIAISEVVHARIPLLSDKYFVHVFDMQTQEKISSALWAGMSPPFILGDLFFSISQDNELLAINHGGIVRIYEIKTGKKLHQFDCYQWSSVDISHSSKFLWINGLGVHACDIKTGQKLFSLTTFGTKHWVVVAADGRYDGSKEILNYIKIKPNGRSDKPENYFSPKDKPNLHVDGLLTTFFNAPMPDHYWIKTPEQIQPIINQQQNKKQIQQQK